MNPVSGYAHCNLLAVLSSLAWLTTEEDDKISRDREETNRVCGERREPPMERFILRSTLWLFQSFCTPSAAQAASPKKIQRKIQRKIQKEVRSFAFTRLTTGLPLSRYFQL